MQSSVLPFLPCNHYHIHLERMFAARTERERVDVASGDHITRTFLEHAKEHAEVHDRLRGE